MNDDQYYVRRHPAWVRWVVWAVVLALLLPVIISTVVLIAV